MNIGDGVPAYLKRAWKELSKKGDESKWNAIRLSNSYGVRQPLLAIDEAGLHHLLIPAENVRYQTNTKSPLAVNVGEQSFVFVDGETIFGRFVDIYCALPNLNDQFDLVIESVLDAVVSANDPAGRAITTVNSWRRLFATLVEAPKLSLSDKYGFFAELKVLEFLMTNRQDFSGDWWTGPLRKAHDFELPEFSIEVKAISDRSNAVSINGLDQLATIEKKQLHLIIVSVEVDPNGLTIGELLDSVVYGSSHETLIRNRAASAGVFGSADDEDRFRATKVGGTVISDRFPRIIPDSLSDLERESIIRVSYDVSLASIQPLLRFVEPSAIGSLLDG